MLGESLSAGLLPKTTKRPRLRSLQMIGAPKYQLFHYIQTANRSLKAGSRINEDKIHYVQADKCRGLTVILEYP